MKWILVTALLLVASPGCQHAPPTLTPQATAAFHGTQAIKGLDLFRNFAVDANKQVPPLISTPTMLKVVKYHRSSIILIHDIPTGWKKTVLDGLDETLKDLPAAESQKLIPYVALIKGILAEVQ
jgi:hypothetical protein